MLDKYLTNNNLIITPNYLKKKVITEINNYDKLISFKAMSIEEFINNYSFSYDKNTISYIMDKYNTTVEIALEYIKSLYYIENKVYNSKKLNDLVKLKEELISNNLITFNNAFLYYLEHVNIIIYNYDLDPFYTDIFSKYNYNTVNNKSDSKEVIVYSFNNIYEEVSYVISDIFNKLNNGTDINTIKIVCDSNYYNILDMLCSFSNIPININRKTSLYDLEIGKKIVSLLSSNMSFSDILNNISTEESILNSIIAIFNSYIDFKGNNANLVELVKYDLKHAYLKEKRLKNAISIINIEEVDNNNTNYLLGFNKENYPVIHKDEDFLSDLMKKELNLLTSNEKNILEKDKLLNLIYSSNLIITYKDKDSFNSYNPSLLLNLDNFKVEKKDIEYNFSNLYNKIKLVSEYDNYYKYGIISNNLKLLKANYDLEYDKYDNSFTGINKDTFLNSFSKLGLSYSSLDNYFRCSFRYYINNILNIKEETDDFLMNIGSIFHYVLSKYREVNFDFNKYWDEEASKYMFTLDRLVLLNRLKEELKYDIEIIKKQENYSNMHDYLFENRFNLVIPNQYSKNVYFTGVVDKIIYKKEDNNTLVSIIDYKTGNLPSDLSNVIYGIGMQLPIYLYLVKRNNLFPNSIIVGFYLQKIINKDIKATLGKDIESLKEKELRLVGYSNNDLNVLREFDNTYIDSAYINSLKLKNDGTFYAYSKVLDNKEIDELDKIVESNIKEAANGILSANFSINPKRINNETIGCMYCSFRDICYKKEKDYVDLEKHTGLDFLGGDNNA